MKGVSNLLQCLITVMILNATVYAQELELRSPVNLPVGTNFIVGGYAYGQGNILMDTR